MNYFDTLFLTVTVGAAVGIGTSMARHHGFMGFITGFGVSIIVAFVLLYAVHLTAFICMKRKRRRAR